MSRWLAMALSLSLSSCDDGGEADEATGSATDGSSDSNGDTPPLGDGSCELAASLSGASQWSTPSAPGCGIPFGPDAGISMIFLFTDGEIQAITIDVADVTEGETGTFAATMEIEHADGRTWTAADCTVDIDEHAADPGSDDEFSRAYLVHATGTCASPAQSEEMAAEPIEIDPFELRFPARWS